MGKDLNQKKGGMRLLTMLMVFVIAVTAVINCVCVYNVFGGTPEDYMRADGVTSEQESAVKQRRAEQEQEQSRRESGQISYSSGGMSAGSMSSLAVNDADDAVQALSTVGLSSADFSYDRTVSNDYFDVYDMKQLYNGIEVYGSGVKVTADKDGNLLFVSGQKTPLDDFDTYSEYGELDCREALWDYLNDEYELTDEEIGNYGLVRIDALGRKIVFIEDEPLVAYVYNVMTTIEDVMLCNRIFIDSNSLDVLQDVPIAMDSMITAEYEGQTGKRMIDLYKDSDDKYILKDTDRNIAIYYYVEGIDFDDDAFAISFNPKKAEPAKEAVDALATVQTIYDTYNELFNRKGLNISPPRALNDLINVMIAAPADWLGDNAAMYQNYMYIGVSTTGGPTMAAHTDFLAHEYTHGIIDFSSTLHVPGVSGPQQGAINEGIADIMAEVIEDQSDNGDLDDSNDWKFVDNYYNGKPARDHANVDNCAESGQHRTSYRDYNIDGNIEDHNGSTIISHAACLMNNGIDGKRESLSMGEIGDLFYYTIPQLDSSTGFQTLRYDLENQALLMNADYHNDEYTHSDSQLSDKQVETVMDALDAAQIPRAIYDTDFDLYRSITPGCELTVYDYNNSVISDYDLSIERLSDGEEIFSEHITKKNYKLTGIQPGIYKFIFSDPENPNSKVTVKAWVNDNDLYSADDKDRYSEKTNIFTNFNSPQREVVLVLDNSGSMSGTPLDETKASAKKFIDYVFSENPSISISVVTYSDSAYTEVSQSSDKDEILDVIDGMYASGGTNMHDAIDTAWDILKESSCDKRLMIVMSDGYPCVGPTEGYSDYFTPVVNIASDVKDDGILIYSLGFFHNLYGSELQQCEELMESIASEGYGYNVSDVSELGFAFDEMADNVSGSYSILVRIACPVEVTVSYNGEVLSSSENNLNTKTSFGTLSFEGDDDEIKVLKLSDDANYEVFINGTGKGTMDYSISFADENGEYSDVRTFKKVPINDETLISTHTGKSGHTTLSVDKDGDGKVDATYSAGRNRKGRVQKSNIWLIVAVASGAILLVLLAAEIVLIIKRAKRNKVCHSCGQAVSRETVYCRTCGAQVKRVPLLLPDRTGRKKQTPTVIVAKLVVMGICILTTVGVVAVYRSAATNVFQSIRNQDLMMAENVYEEHVADSGLPAKYLDFATSHYLKKVEKERAKGRFGDDTADIIYQTVSGMDMGEASETAENYLENLDTSDKA
ncbi:MAG: VWA domain-containing protein [Ruminococcus sp.]|nr:VWA domain-containing protein [Ruminococcus sp.]